MDDSLAMPYADRDFLTLAMQGQNPESQNSEQNTKTRLFQHGLWIMRHQQT